MPEPFCSTEVPTPHAGEFVAAVNAGKAEEVRELLANHADLREQIDSPWFAFDAPAIVAASGNRSVVDVLLENGADIDAPSQWWAGGFKAIDHADTEVADYLLTRGATLDAYAAARHGKLEELKALVAADPECVNLAGGDGQRPLHVASSIEIVDFLLDHGADLEIRDVDHEATPVQYQVVNPEICRHLISRGATPDIFLACALGDLDLVKKVIASEPDAPRSKVGRCPHTKMSGENAGGHIYTWGLHGAKTPMRVASLFEQREVFDYLYHLESDPRLRFLQSCWDAHETAVREILDANPDILSTLEEDERVQLVEAAWEGRRDAIRVMLDAGWDPHVKDGEKMTALHRAAFHGEREILELLLSRDEAPLLEDLNAYGGTVLTTLMYGAVHGWKKDTDYPGGARVLVEAGSVLKKEWLPCGNEAVDQVLRKYV